jgi:phosphatidylserine decarboxylase
MSDYNFHTFIQHLLPQHTLSRLAGLVTNCKVPWLKNWLIDKFIAYYGVDMTCAEQSDPHAYATFNQFFTRKLKAGTRSIVQDEKLIACPVDGTVSQAGVISAHSILQAKGFSYDLQRLLGGSAEHTKLFRDGSFATLYLAPKDYHRVHMPLAGTLREMIYVPGKLFSVNTATANSVENLFARNERVIAVFDTVAGPMAIVLIGAMLVASIHMAWAGMIAPTGQRPLHWNYAEQTIALGRGAEVGHFQLGSTVVVLFGRACVEWTAQLQPGQSVQLGQAIGKICS